MAHTREALFCLPTGQAMTNEPQIYFSRHAVCSDLTRLITEHLSRDSSFGRPAELSKGTYIWRQGDAANSIFFLRRGQVALKAADTEGHEVIIRVVEEGDPFGELCLCAEGHGERRTSACAVVPSEAIEVSLDRFVDFLQKNHEALKNLLFTFCIRLADAERRIGVLAHRGAEERLGNLLLSLAAAQGRGTSDGDLREVSLTISHEQLAQMAAMSRAHTTITMGKFRSRGLVGYRRGQPVRVVVPALKKFLNERNAEG